LPARPCIYAGMNDRTPIPLRPDRTALAHDERRALHRAVACVALGAARRVAPATVLKTNWPGDRRAELLLRSATSPTTSAEFPPTEAVGAFRSLAPGSVALALFGRGLQIDFAGVSTVHVPSVAQPAQHGFVGETQAAPVIALNFRKVTVGPLAKLLLLSAVSTELENASAESVVGIVGRILADTVRKSLDSAVFSDFAGDDITPRGLLAGAVEVPAADAGDDALTADISELIGAVADQNIDVTDIIIIAEPRLAALAEMRVSPKFTTTIMPCPALPAGAIAAVAPGALASGFLGGPQVESSRQVTIQMLDADPLSDALAAGPTLNAFQSDLVSIRVRARGAWAIEEGGVAVIRQVSWAPARAASAGGRHGRR
jgi:Phage capsid family